MRASQTIGGILIVGSTLPHPASSFTTIRGGLSKRFITTSLKNQYAVPKTSQRNKRGLYVSIGIDDVLTDEPFSGGVNSTFSSNEEVLVPDVYMNTTDIARTTEKESNLKDTKASIDVSTIAPYKDLILFMGTTVLIWLSEPLLSLVDTTIVGKFGSNVASGAGAAAMMKGISLETIQLAALGPATMLCDNLIYLTFFLAMATTNQLARASAKSDNSLQVKTTSHALGVGSILGVLITLTIFIFGGSLLQYIIGSGGAMVNGVDFTKPIIALSWDYSKIRGIFAPLAIMGMIAQSVSLATLDTRTPALAVLLASIVNIFGDAFLVAKLGMGLRGAAIATAAASTISSLVLIRAAKKKVTKWKSPKDKTSFVSLPDLPSLIALVKLAGPIFFVTVGKLVCYSAMTLKASNFGMMPMAAHNIMLRVFFFFTTFGDSFSLAAQSYLPKAFYSNASSSSSSETSDADKDTESEQILDSISDDTRSLAKSLMKRIISLAAITGVSISVWAKLIMERGGSMFTNDAVLLSLMRDPSRVAYLMGSVLMHPLIMTMEGSLLATRDLKYLMGSYGVTMAIMLAILKFGTDSFTGVWRALFLFQSVRFTSFGWRVIQKYRNRSVSKKAT